MSVGIRMPISDRCARALNVLPSGTKAGMYILSFPRKATEI